MNFNFVYSGLKNEIAEIIFDVFSIFGGNCLKKKVVNVYTQKSSLLRKITKTFILIFPQSFIIN